MQQFTCGPNESFDATAQACRCEIGYERIYDADPYTTVFERRPPCVRAPFPWSAAIGILGVVAFLMWRTTG